jgi:hypothetical protein
VSGIKNKRLRHNLFLASFTCIYIYSIYKAHKSENEVLRIGAAGSLTTLIGESSFYFIDAINARSKILTNNVSFTSMLKKVLKNEGVGGLFKGYTACYYSSIFYGYLYFYMYKGIKCYMKESEMYQNSKSTSFRALIYASSSTIAEVISLLIYYPYELVKIRLLTKNDIYKYESVSDAFVKIVRKDGVRGLYRGCVSFFFAFLGQYTMQMTTYELLTDGIIKEKGLDHYHEHQNFYVIRSSVISGIIAGFITNPLEVIVLRK